MLFVESHIYFVVASLARESTATSLAQMTMAGCKQWVACVLALALTSGESCKNAVCMISLIDMSKCYTGELPHT